MVKVLKKISQFIRGETNSEFNQRKTFQKELKKESREASQEARKDETLKFIRTKERLRRESKERALRRRFNPPSRPDIPSITHTPFNRGGIGTNLATGGIISNPKNSRKRRKTRSTRTNLTPKNFDVLGFG